MHKYFFRMKLFSAFFSEPKNNSTFCAKQREKCLYKISFLTHAFEKERACYWRPDSFSYSLFAYDFVFLFNNFWAAHLIIHLCRTNGLLQRSILLRKFPVKLKKIIECEHWPLAISSLKRYKYLSQAVNLDHFHLLTHTHMSRNQLNVFN